MNFQSNKEMNLGVEIELQLIDRVNGDLSPVATQLLKKISKEPYSEHVKSEIFQSMLEIDTPICKNAQEVGVSLRRSLQQVREAANFLNTKIMMAGTHPFALYSERLLTPESRYYTLVDRNQWITRRLQIFGLHVHLGMKDGNQALAFSNALCHYLPIILALSASSPFWHNEDTGLASSRITFFEATPTGGHPYMIKDWAEFERLVDNLVRSGSITSMKDLWWDIRPNLDFGTIEIRIADCPPTIREVEALVAVIHVLAVLIERDLKKGKLFSAPPEWIYRENKWRASRYGVESRLIIDKDATTQSFREVWETLDQQLKPLVNEYDYNSFFELVSQLVHRGPSYSRQRKAYEKGREYLINHLVHENEKDSPIWDS